MKLSIIVYHTHLFVLNWVKPRQIIVIPGLATGRPRCSWNGHATSRASRRFILSLPLWYILIYIYNIISPWFTMHVTPGITRASCEHVRRHQTFQSHETTRTHAMLLCWQVCSLDPPVGRCSCHSDSSLHSVGRCLRVPQREGKVSDLLRNVAWKGRPRGLKQGNRRH